MMRVLFVDDEPDVLEGLENRLHLMRDRIEARFAESATAALILLGQHEMDAVVTDMRMPGMDGAELLSILKRDKPQLIRIMLSGETGRGGFLRALHSAQQVLAKPCDIRQLESVLEDCRALRDHLADPQIVAALGAYSTLPCMPRTIEKLNQSLMAPSASLSGFARVVEDNPGLSARVLQVANSAFLGVASPVTTAADAVRLLGTDLILGLAMAHELFSTDSAAKTPRQARQLEQAQDRALLAARCIRRLVPDESRRSLAFTAAILHAVGDLVLAGVDRVDNLAEPDSRRLRALAGAYLLSLWGLPLRLVEAIAYHLQPAMDRSTRGDGESVAGPLHLARLFAQRRLDQQSIDAAYDPDYLDADYLRTRQLDLHALRRLEQDVTRD